PYQQGTQPSYRQLDGSRPLVLRCSRVQRVLQQARPRTRVRRRRHRPPSLPTLHHRPRHARKQKKTTPNSSTSSQPIASPVPQPSPLPRESSATHVPPFAHHQTPPAG